VALVAFCELGGDEFGAGAGDDLLVEAGLELGFERTKAADVAHLEDRRADRHVGLRQRDAFFHGARGVADLEAHVPQHVEDELDRLMRLFRRLRLEQEEQVDIRARRQRVAAIAADGGHRELVLLLREDVVGGKFVENGDDLVLQPGDPPRAFQAAAVGRQQLARLVAPIRAGLLEDCEQIGAHRVRPVLVGLHHGVALLAQIVGVENVGEIDIVRRRHALGGFLFARRGHLLRLSFRLHAL